MNDEEIKGVIYFSNGSDLIKYNFATKKKEILFVQREKSELGRNLTNITYPVYLKSKNRILFVGSTPYPDPNHDYIFESDLNLKNLKQYRNMKNVRMLSISPDESMIAYYRHPNKLAIKRCDDLAKDGHDNIVADNFLCSPLWLSSSELVYEAINNNVVKLDILTGEQQIIMKDIFCSSISPDGKSVLAFSSDNKTSYIYLYDVASLRAKVILKGSKQQISSPEIWSPNGKYFIFTKLRGVNFGFNIRKLWHDLMASLEERHDLHLYSLSTNKETKIIEDEITFGGFWLEK